MQIKNIIELAFELLGKAFNKVPLLKKIEGYRTIIGLVGLAVVYLAKMQGWSNPEVLNALHMGFEAFIGLSLAAKVAKAKAGK